MLCPDWLTGSVSGAGICAAAGPVSSGMTEETKSLSEPGMFLESWSNFFFKVQRSEAWEG